ncbi:hypothetical protein GRI38_11760 [Altererythrobacter aurantiacus]|uniref:FAS1-like dehydratase domain-containing protein n=1 Tax=Parapontixanthobacter aurantiacus TaxID=1463599 RepID=A0A844ZDU4_9SPHN|nr:MaoC family dehydratase N-terminal domain-containing protein [Parapontixanthobacter aurantiacus]MXO86701.1 hypothetical protein [Parapontixanthobacter aurantiacus]
MPGWKDWIGRREVRRDRLTTELAARWLATFDKDARSEGTMPQGIHLCLATPDARTAELGDDGHPRRTEDGSSFLPAIPMPRRMWAGSRFQFHSPLTIGAQIERVSHIVSIEKKSGATGPLVFVEIEHDTLADAELAVRERQTLVYREAAPSDAPLSPAIVNDANFDEAVWDAHHVITPDERLLFRYSALTFNTHRIHYDRPYAEDVERYRGLVVHGPLIATMLLDLAQSKFGDNTLSEFSFRGLSPAIAGEELHLVLRRTGEDTIELAAFAGDGRQVTKAEARLMI